MNINNDFDINQPPEGAWIRQESDTLVLGATTHSSEAFFLIPFAIIWTIGVCWLIIGTQIYTGDFNWGISLLGIPFLMAAVRLVKRALTAMWGKIEYQFDEKNFKILGGNRIFQDRASFPLNTLQFEIKTDEKGSPYFVLLSEGKSVFKLIDQQSWDLGTEKHDYLMSALYKILSDRQKGKNFLKQDLSEHLI